MSIRAPDHLGDGVLAVATIRALARAFSTRVHAPRWGAWVYDGLDVVGVDDPPEGDVGVLLKPSFGAAWRWRRLPRRVGLAESARGWLLTDPVPVRREHRRDGYARVAAALGVTVAPVDVAPAAPALPRGAAPDLPAGFVGLNPWSPTATVRWPHFRALADALAARGDAVVFFAGPGEGDAVRAVAGPHRVVAGLPLPDFAAALDRCRVFVSGDSGAAHVAVACGVRTVVVHGSTDPARTGPTEALGRDAGVAVVGPRWCAPCYRKSCPFGVACLAAIPVARVLDAVDAAGGGAR